jgi:hypothetical protein
VLNCNEEVSESGSIAPHILNLGTASGYLINLMPGCYMLRVKSLGGLPNWHGCNAGNLICVLKFQVLMEVTMKYFGSDTNVIIRNTLDFIFNLS